MNRKSIIAVALASLVGLSSHAQVKVGIITGATGPGASLGIPYKNTFTVLPKTLGGEAVQYIIMDDATDPTNAVKHARKLISEDKVDLIIGSSSVPSATSITDVAAELKTPQIALSPVGPAASKNPWVFTIPQPAAIMMGAVADHMKANKVKNVAYIGFSDAWGDLVLNGLKSHADSAGIKIVAEERYGRNDTSVAGQILKIIATNPDAVVVGGSGTPGALPHVTLAERGYKGKVYHNHGVINKDFLRVGGKNIEGGFAPTRRSWSPSSCPTAIRPRSPPWTSPKSMRQLLELEAAMPSQPTRMTLISWPTAQWQKRQRKPNLALLSSAKPCVTPWSAPRTSMAPMRSTT